MENFGQQMEKQPISADKRVLLGNMMQIELAGMHGEDLGDFIEKHAEDFRDVINAHPEFLEDFEKDREGALSEVEKIVYH